MMPICSFPGLKPDPTLSNNPELAWVREVPWETTVVCDWGLQEQMGLVTCRMLCGTGKSFYPGKGKKIPPFLCMSGKDLFYHLGCRWELCSCPLLHRDNTPISVLLLPQLGHAKNCLWCTVISFMLLVWEINSISIKKYNTLLWFQQCYLDW